MKHSLIVLALMASFGAWAQDSTSTSGSQSGSASNSTVNAVGNENTAGAQSGSQSGANSTSTSGAAGNVVVIDQSGPTVQTINANSSSEANVNEKYDGTQRVIQSGTTTQNVIHSGSTKQTIRNVPGIAMSGPASGPCTGASGGLGLAGPGWGLGLNGAKVEPTCVVRENVRVIGMAMQSLDGAAFPNEKAELMQMMLDAVRGLGAMNQAIIGDNLKAPK